jgi:hypothetical protein
MRALTTQKPRSVVDPHKTMCSMALILEPTSRQQRYPKQQYKTTRNHNKDARRNRMNRLTFSTMPSNVSAIHGHANILTRSAINLTFIAMNKTISTAHFCSRQIQNLKIPSNLRHENCKIPQTERNEDEMFFFFLN